MGILIKGGTVVNADRAVRADVYCDGGVIRSVGGNLDVPAGTESMDAGGCLIMPGGIDPHTHMQLPFMVEGAAMCDLAMGGWYYDDNRFRHTGPETEHHGCLSPVARLGGEGCL